MTHFFKIITILLIPAFCQAASLHTNVSKKRAKKILSRSGCLACHGIKRKVIGPSYKQVSKRYFGDSEANEKLFDKVRKGGSGSWGKVAMPANPPSRITDKDLKYVIEYILGICKNKECKRRKK